LKTYTGDNWRATVRNRRGVWIKLGQRRKTNGRKRAKGVKDLLQTGVGEKQGAAKKNEAAHTKGVQGGRENRVDKKGDKKLSVKPNKVPKKKNASCPKGAPRVVCGQNPPPYLEERNKTKERRKVKIKTPTHIQKK